jgi:hypothetical protein
MDPLSAFGLATGVLQITIFAREFARVSHEIYKDGSPKQFEEMGRLVKDFELAQKGLSMSIANNPKPLSDGDKVSNMFPVVLAVNPFSMERERMRKWASIESDPVSGSHMRLLS